MIKNLLIGVGVTCVLAFGFGFLDALTGTSTTSGFTLPIVFGTLTFLALQGLSGNRKEVRVDEASRQASLSAAAPSGQALLYVYREGFVGKFVGWNVSLDGTALAQLKSPRFTQAILSRGSHTLTVSLSGFAGTKNKPAETRFEAQPGEVIVFVMKLKMGALCNALSFVREEDTRAALRKFSRIPMVAAERTAA